MRVLGILLVVSGVLLMVYGGITLIIPSDVVDLGALSITINENIVVPMPPIVGLFFLVIGIVMIMNAPVALPPPY